MAILLEGVSLVFENSTIESKYPGGMFGFRSTWNNESFCRDSMICRVSYFDADDAFCTLLALKDYELIISTTHSGDVAVFQYGGKLLLPCIWLESMITHDNLSVCRHVLDKNDTSASVPDYFRHGRTIARFGNMEEDALKARLSPAGTQNGTALYRDNQTDHLLFGPNALQRH